MISQMCGRATIATLGLVLALGPAARGLGREAPEEPLDLEWPLLLETEGGTIVVYQPQMETMTQVEAQARAAVSVTPAGESEPHFGAMWFWARIETDLDDRIVDFADLQVTAARFPTIDESEVGELKRIVETEIPRYDLTMSLDQFLAGLEAIETKRTAADQLRHEPPRILHVQEPSVLVLIDGEPRLARVEDADLEYVVNTPFLIVKEQRDFYLRGGTQWWKSKAVAGPWEPVDAPSDAVGRFAEQAAPDSQGPGSLDEPEEFADLVVPNVYVSTEPAELIESAGKPEWTPVGDTDLLFMTNTESDVFMSIESQEVHVLLAGRWFASRSLSEGPWRHVAPQDLPDDFAKMPPDSTYEHVLASVPGTLQAQEALLENVIPQTATVSRAETTLEVEYDGEPRFEAIEESDMKYAVNTESAVFLVDGSYYACGDGVWFVAGSASGPWIVCDDVPDKIRTIPPSCPHYNVKYVYVYRSTPEVVYVGYTPGYVGSYVYGGCVVYGTGWIYRPWYGHVYYPRVCTWGFHVRYNPYTGWGFGFSYGYGGWFRVGVGWGGGWWGPRGYRYGYRHGYHHGYHAGYRHGARAGYRAGYRAAQGTPRATNRNVYDRGRQGVRTREDRVAAGRDRDRDRAARDRSPGSDRPALSDRSRDTRPKPRNDVYTDREGNVFRQRDDGSWQGRDKGGWTSSERPRADQRGDGRGPGSPGDRAQRDRSPSDRSATDMQQDRSRQRLDRDSRARQRGQQRSDSFQSRRGGARGGRR